LTVLTFHRTASGLRCTEATRFTLDALIMPARSAASIVAANSVFDARFTKAFAPACQARRINRRLGLQERPANEDLPIAVLDPLPHHVLISRSFFRAN